MTEPRRHKLLSPKPERHPHDNLLYFMRMFLEAPAAFIVTDPDWIVLDANAAAQTVLARPLVAMRHKPFRLLVSARDRYAFAAMASDMVTFPFNSSRPLSMKSLTGDDIDVIFRAALIRTPEGEPEYIAWMFIESPSGEGPDLL